MKSKRALVMKKERDRRMRKIKTKFETKQTTSKVSQKACKI